MNPTSTSSPIFADLPTGKDTLDFQPYVEALSEILLDQHTETPLTLGVFGSWGSGKTSLMTMLKERLGHTPRRRTVWFNAWKYHQEEALWRAFILRVLDALYPREAGEGAWETRPRLPLEKLSEAQQEQVQLLERLQRSLYQTVEWEDLGRWALNWQAGGKARRRIKHGMHVSRSSVRRQGRRTCHGNGSPCWSLRTTARVSVWVYWPSHPVLI